MEDALRAYLYALKTRADQGNTLRVSLYALKTRADQGKENTVLSHEQAFLMKPKVDFCFKELMEDAEVRKGFISALLGIRPEEIVWTKLLPTHLRKEHPEDKLGILDIRVSILEHVKGKDDSSESESQMDLEIQLAPFPLWPERSIFYLSKMFTGEIHKGQDYEVLQKCIHVGILDFMLFEEDDEFYSCFHLWEDHRRRMYSDKLEIHILELPKLKERDYPDTELLNWARFFNAEQKEEFEMAAEASPYVKKAFERLMDISEDEEKRLEYEAREKAIRDHNYLMNYNLKRGLEEGREQGLQQGLKQGLEQGVQQGLKQGLEQSTKAFIEMCQDDSYSKEETISRLVRRLSLSPEAAKEYLEKYWKA